MGSILSVPTTLSVALIAGGVVYGFLQKRPPPPDWASPSNRAVLPGEVAIPPAEPKGQKKKKAAAREGAQSATQTEVEPTVVAFPAVVPGGFDTQPQSEPAPASAATAASKAKKKKKGKKAAGAASVPLDAQSDSSATAPESSSTPVPRPPAKRKNTPVLDDGPWTRVESRKRTAAPQEPAPSSSAAPASDITTSVTGTSSPVTERTEDEQALGSEDNRRTLAERLLPKPRKTHVEDMLETPDVPSVARVMRVTPRADERPAAGFSWGDYEDVNDSGVTADDADGEDEGGWITKSTRARPKSSTPSTPSQTAPESLTKKQRQNQKKKELEKAEKAAARAEQEAALARHKRELEKVRMQEQFAKGKKASGGMKASVDAKGHMVFE